MRHELESWGLPDSALDDPHMTQLRLLTQTRMRCDMYASLLQRQYEESDTDEQAPTVWYSDEDEDGTYSLPGPVIPKWVAGLIGFKYGSAGKDGKIYATEEGVRALADLEFRERRFLKDLCESAARMGIAERQIEIAQAQASMMYRMIVQAVERAGIEQAAADLVLSAMGDVIRSSTMIESAT